MGGFSTFAGAVIPNPVFDSVKIEHPTVSTSNALRIEDSSANRDSIFIKKTSPTTGQAITIQSYSPGAGNFPAIIWDNFAGEMATVMFGKDLGGSSNPVGGLEILLSHGTEGLGRAFRLESQGTVLNPPTARFEGDVYARGVMLTSDRELKDKIHLASVERIRKSFALLEPVRFKWKDDQGEEHWGFVAQDLERAIPEAVSGAKKEKAYDVSQLLALTVAEVQRQAQLITVLEQKLKQNAWDSGQMALSIASGKPEKRKAK